MEFKPLTNSEMIERIVSTLNSKCIDIILKTLDESFYSFQEYMDEIEKDVPFETKDSYKWQIFQLDIINSMIKDSLLKQEDFDNRPKFCEEIIYDYVIGYIDESMF